MPYEDYAKKHKLLLEELIEERQATVCRMGGETAAEDLAIRVKHLNQLIEAVEVASPKGRALSSD